MSDNIDTLEDELEVILENVHTMGMSDQLIGIKQHYWLKQRAKFKQALNLYIEEKVKEARKNEASHRITDGLDRLIRLDGQWELLKILDEYKSALSVDQITDEDIKKGWPKV